MAMVNELNLNEPLFMFILQFSGSQLIETLIRELFTKCAISTYIY